DVAMGKITDTGTGFFRIVLPEHLLMVPIGLIISSLLMKNERHNGWWYFFLGATLLVLVLNLSRAYALAFVGGLLELKISHAWKRWLTVSCGTLLATVLLFTSVHFLASRGTSFGWELFGIRVLSVFQPTLEISSYTRMELLSPIFTMMQKHPLLGSGLGATVTFIDPSTNIQVTTPHFDWGYFEMLVELGPLGLVAFLLVIGFAIFELAQKIRRADDWHDFYVGLLGGVAAFLIMTLTTPALFHVFGIVFLLLVFTVSMKPHTIFDDLIPLLYRIFNRIKKVQQP
ncbi:MAG: O-antigen ligase family protein, partial [Patescibacteria group bacterium]